MPVVRPLWLLHAAHRSFQASPAGSVPVAPPWAATVALTALLAGSLLAALVGHATRLDPIDAWVMRWQELASAHARRLAAVVSATLAVEILLKRLMHRQWAGDPALLFPSGPPRSRPRRP